MKTVSETHKRRNWEKKESREISKPMALER